MEQSTIISHVCKPLVDTETRVHLSRQHDEMPLTCAEQTLRDIEGRSDSNDSADRDENRRLIALLESHSARRTWRQAKPPQEREYACRQDVGAGSAPPKILSFTANFSGRLEPAKNELERPQTAVQVPGSGDSKALEVATILSGILLDTPES